MQNKMVEYSVVHIWFEFEQTDPTLSYITGSTLSDQGVFPNISPTINLEIFDGKIKLNIESCRGGK